jgi:hypothetical protein
MNKVASRTICDRCGQEVYQRDLHIQNLGQLDTSSKGAYVKSLIELEGVTEEVAISWAEHGLFLLCEKAVRNCPKCSAELKTWRAKLCLSCGAEFEPWSMKDLHS